MDDILAKKNRHLFLEEKDNAGNSFIANVNNIVDDLDNIDAVANDLGRIDTVADNIDNVNTVAENIDDINTTVENLDKIDQFNDNLIGLLESLLEQLGEDGNAWLVRLTELGESILATTSAFNYAVTTTLVQDIASGATLTLPDAMKYRVGTHMLMVSWNGTVCYIGDQYNEIGDFGEWSTSIFMHVPLKTGDKIQFRVVALADAAAFVGQIDSVIGNTSVVATGSTENRTLADRFADIINVKDYGAKGDGVTDDTEAIQSAVTKAYTIGCVLFWPAGTYLTETSITNLHAVQHAGDGKISRNGNSFAVGNLSGNTNTLFVSSTAGSDSNDGLSASEPLQTLQAAVNVLQNYGPYLRGTWVVEIVAGTYAKVRFQDQGLQSENFIQFNGPSVEGHPNVPTVIVTNGAGAVGYGLYVVNSTRIQCSNIKFVGYNGSYASCGIMASDRSYIKTINCHFDSCARGIWVLEFTTIDVKGGIFSNCGFDANSQVYNSGAGIHALFHCKFSVGTQNAGDLTNGPIFKNCVFGVYAQEHNNGHIDWCTFEDNSSHVRLNICSRLNMDGSSFKRATGVAVWAQDNSVISFSNACTFGSGDDKNNVNFICNSGATIGPNFLFDSTFRGGLTTSRCCGRNILNQVFQSTSVTPFNEIVVKGGLLINNDSYASNLKSFHFKVWGVLSGSTDEKRIIVRIGTTPLVSTIFTASQTGAFECNATIFIKYESSIKVYGIISSSLFGEPCRTNNGVIDDESFEEDTSIRLDAQLDDDSDSITIIGCESFVDGI